MHVRVFLNSEEVSFILSNRGKADGPRARVFWLSYVQNDTAESITHIQEVDAITFRLYVRSKGSPDGGVSHFGESDLSLNLKTMLRKRHVDRSNARKPRVIPSNQNQSFLERNALKTLCVSLPEIMLAVV